VLRRLIGTILAAQPQSMSPCELHPNAEPARIEELLPLLDRLLTGKPHSRLWKSWLTRDRLSQIDEDSSLAA
jgi:hypothetical protein